VRRAIRLAAAVVVAAMTCGMHGATAGAQDDAISGPTVTLDRHSMRPGERVLVTLDGFRGNAVTLSVCGNQARRGSVDCNMAASEGIRLDRDGTSTLTEVPIEAPDTTCPCLVRVSTKTFDQLAVAPIELIGHPVGPIVGSSALTPLEVSVSARRAPHGLIANVRSALGGPTAYDVTVSVRNRSTERLEHIVLAGAAGRSRDDDSTALELPVPGPLDPGQTWEQVVRSELPAPVLGGFVWEVTASGAGPSVTASDTTRSWPLGFVLLVLVFLGTVGAIVWRRIARHRALDADDDAEDMDGHSGERRDEVDADRLVVV